jgi:hypothetical protein
MYVQTYSCYFHFVLIQIQKVPTHKFKGYITIGHVGDLPVEAELKRMEAKGGVVQVIENASCVNQIITRLAITSILGIALFP